MDSKEYGTALAMQRTTMAFVRTAVSISGLGRTSSSARVQYWCDFAALSMLFVGVSQHFFYGLDMFTPAEGREHRLKYAFFSAGLCAHYTLLMFCLIAGLAGGFAAFVWMDELPGPIPFILAAT